MKFEKNRYQDRHCRFVNINIFDLTDDLIIFTESSHLKSLVLMLIFFSSKFIKFKQPVRPKISLLGTENTPVEFAVISKYQVLLLLVVLPE